MLRPILVFIHVSSAMGIFGAMAIECAALLQLRGAVDPSDARRALNGYGLVRIVAIPSLLLTIASGIYLTVTVWGWEAAWIKVGFSSMLVMAVIGVIGTGVKVTRRRDAILWASLVTRVFIVLGIIFLMTVKPPLQMSLIAMAIAVVAGIVASLPLVRVPA
jgi:hypothetical protein